MSSATKKKRNFFSLCVVFENKKKEMKTVEKNFMYFNVYVCACKMCICTLHFFCNVPFSVLLLFVEGTFGLEIDLLENAGVLEMFMPESQ